MSSVRGSLRALIFLLNLSLKGNLPYWKDENTVVGTIFMGKEVVASVIVYQRRNTVRSAAALCN